jgi:hypothetical protein
LIGVGARNVFVKINSNAAYRAKFIKDPIGVLAKEGVTLKAKDQKQLLAVIDKIRKNIPNLGELPMGYEAAITAVARNGPDTDEDPAPLLLL